MNGVAIFYHAHDSAGGLSIIVCCHYCFMQRGIKALTQRIDFVNIEPLQGVLKHPVRGLHAFD